MDGISLIRFPVSQFRRVRKWPADIFSLLTSKLFQNFGQRVLLFINVIYVGFKECGIFIGTLEIFRRKEKIIRDSFRFF